MTPVLQLGVIDVLLYGCAVWLASKLLQSWLTRPRGTTTMALLGPASKSFVFGLHRYINEADDPGLIYEEWAAEYGPAYRVPGSFGASKIMIVDPKAAAHFYSRETYGYVMTPLARMFIKNLFGRGLLWANGDSHKRQRKALSPAFSNAAIRRLTSVFYDSSYKMKANWESIIDASPEDGAIIDVEKWMNHISLDSIGIAGFGHNFGSLDGKHSAVIEVFEAMGTGERSLISHFVFLLGPALPLLLKLPTGQNRLFKRLHVTMSAIADELLARTRKEKEGLGKEGGAAEKSIIGLLVKAENADEQLHMTQEEIMAQMNTLLVAGYDTTSISLTWALIELARQPEKQQKLRAELAPFTGTDPSWEQLSTALPYLDAVVHEVLRLHPPVTETSRIAAEDDLIPFSSPFTTLAGTQLTHLPIAKGAAVSVPIRALNRSAALWGPTAKEFEPERWLEGAPEVPAMQIQGHRHLLTFSDGPRTCLGKGFALAEFKAALSVLIRNYTFELPDGPGTKIERHRSILPRPKVAGQNGAKVPLWVRRVEQ